MKKQEDKVHYNWNNYVTMKRWGSYWHQINEVNQIKPSSLLIVGPGDNIIKHVLHAWEKEIEIKTLDIADDLNPNYLGSVSELTKVTNSTFDCILCNQVLEHLPWELFDTCLQELHKGSNGYVIISLPQKYLEFSLSLSLFSINVVNWFFACSVVKWYRKFKFPTSYGHYWELGTSKNTSQKEVERSMRRYFDIIRTYTISEYPYHRFFILKKRTLDL